MSSPTSSPEFEYCAETPDHLLQLYIRQGVLEEELEQNKRRISLIRSRLESDNARLDALNKRLLGALQRFRGNSTVPHPLPRNCVEWGHFLGREVSARYAGCAPWLLCICWEAFRAGLRRVAPPTLDWEPNRYTQELYILGLDLHETVDLYERARSHLAANWDTVIARNRPRDPEQNAQGDALRG